ncbi:MAG TPA: gephyrin-like molybdotransferase Glp [Candidatus Sulfotelmatobacter sp.]
MIEAMTPTEKHASGADPSLVLSFEQARRMVENHAAGIAELGFELVNLLEASGRVLAKPISADRDFPPFPRATRDGYAVRSEDVSKIPAMLDLIGEIKAGQRMEDIPSVIGSGEAVSIMTGAPVPLDCDAVVMVEYTSRHGERVEVTRGVTPGENVVPLGAEARSGDVLLARGIRLNDAGIAVAASVGKARVEVFRQPRVAISSTGDELVGLEDVPGPTQIRNSNSYSLAAQVKAAGGKPVLLPSAPDEPARLRGLIEEGLQADLLLLTGGVSMGRYDLVEQVLSEMQAEFFFTGAQIQPGRPVVFGRCGAGARRAGNYHYFFGLPGNPVSTMVTFELFARPVLEALAGMAARPLRFLHAKLRSEICVKTGLKRFLPAILSGEFEDSVVDVVRWQGSGDIAATARSNCYVVIAPDREKIAAGEFVAVMMR